MKCLVVGSGFVGEVVCRLLHECGYTVKGVVKSAESAGELSRKSAFAVEAADVSDLASVRELASRNLDVDVVVHCASSGRGGDREAAYRGIYLEGCRNLIASFAGGRLVFVGSSSVYGQQDGGDVTEESETNPGSATSRILLEAERVALDAGGTVVRLAGIYGPGRSFLLKRFLEGAAAIDGDSPEAEGRWVNQIHRDDAATAIARLVESTDAEGIFNACDDKPMRQRTLYQEFCRRFDRSLPPVKAPDLDRPRGWSDKRILNAKLRASGWQPRYASYFDALDGDSKLLPSVLEALTP